jgi:uncharacterized membrane protein
MEATLVCPTGQHLELPCMRRVAASSPLGWLRAGWQDLLHNRWLSLGYGIWFALVGYVLVDAGWGRTHLAMSLVSGFLLVAPFMAIVFHDLSLRAEHVAQYGESARPFATLAGNAGSVALFGLVLAFAFSAWERLSAIALGLYLGNEGVREAGFAWLLTSQHLPFLAAYALGGALLAGLVFALSVVTLPMLLERRVDIVTAMMTSLRVVRENPLPMLAWAATIVALTAIGFLTQFIAMAVVFPLLGHASWHAYRELVLR